MNRSNTSANKDIGHIVKDMLRLLVAYGVAVLFMGRAWSLRTLGGMTGLAAIFVLLYVLGKEELPQFFNVLGGSMSLVGTRPPTPDEVEKYGTRQWRRISIKPGLTGMWQVNGRSLVTDFEKIVELDVEYIDNWSLMEDIRILCKTVTVLLKHADAY